METSKKIGQSESQLNDDEQETKLQIAKTKADGNCFFHAAFGSRDSVSGTYIARNANEMRQEWFNFLNQFQSLQDGNMPIALKDQLKKIFNIFLDKPDGLTGRSDNIRGLASITKENIQKVNRKANLLKASIAQKFLKDEEVCFRHTIYEIITRANNQLNKEPPTLEELQGDLMKLVNEISNDLRNCAFELDPALCGQQYNQQYNSEFVAISFLEDPNVYANYLEAIKSSSYFVFFEEIPILASIAEIEIKVMRYKTEHDNASETFKRNIALVGGNYQSDRTVWGLRRHVVIYHRNLHFSHVICDVGTSSTKRLATGDSGNVTAKRIKFNTQEASVTDDALKRTESVKANNLDEFLNELTMPSLPGPKFTEHGRVFQLKLLMLCLWRAAHSEENDSSKYDTFRLATEFPEGGNFDDIVFQYKDGSYAKWRFRLVQAKHKERMMSQDSLLKIKLKDLLSISDEEDFSLQKYFRSFLKVRQRSCENSIYSVMPGSEIEDVIIITNTDFHSEKEKNIFEDPESITGDSLFKTEKEDTCVYKLKLGENRDKKIIDDVKVILQKTSDFCRLVEALVDNLCNNKQINKINMFKEYYYPLVNEILSFNVPETKGEKKEYSVNLNNLIDNKGSNGKALSTEAVKIKYALIKQIALKKGIIKNFSIIDLENVFKFGNLEIEFDSKNIRDLFGTNKIIVSEGFARAFAPKENPKIKNVDLFAEQMHLLLCKEEKVFDINDSVMKELKMTSEEFMQFFSNINELAGYVFINRFGKIRFSTAFLNSETFPGNINKWIDAIRKLLGNDFESLYQCEFKFDKKFKTCEDGELYRKLPLFPNDDDINDFFQKLKFIVNYPNRFEISDLLGEEIKNEFKILDQEAFQSLYYEQLHNWMADTVGTFYTAAKAKKLFQQLRDNLLLFWTIDGLNKAYFSKVSTKYEFKKYCVFDEFLSGSEQVLHLVFRELALGRTRIVQRFLQLQREDSADMQKFTRSFGHIFLFLNQLKDKVFLSEISKVLADKKNYNLVVIECNNRGLESTIPELFKQLQAIEEGKKIIFITTDEHDKLASQLRRSSAVQDQSCFDDLKDNLTKKCLLQEKVIIFQDRQLFSFLELMGISEVNDDYLLSNQDSLNKIICTENLIRLIYGIEIIIGGALPTSRGYDKDYYVDRGFNQAVVLNEELIEKSISQFKDYFFFIGGTDSKFKGKSNVHVFNVDAVESTNKKGAELISQNEVANIHYFKWDMKKLIWIKSRGSITNLVKCREVSKPDDPEDLMYENDLVNLNSDKIVIISDSAGAGKSTVLTQLSSIIKDLKQNLWVVRIDLNEYTEIFLEEWKLRKSEEPRFYKHDLDSAIDFLVNYLLISQEGLKLTKESEKELFKSSIRGEGNVALIFDGFDEISPNYKDIVIDLLQVFKESKVKKLIVTTRPSMRAPLESKLGVFSSVLKPFSKPVQIELLTKFWMKNLGLKDLNPKQEERLTDYAKSLLTIFSFSIHGDKTFTVIPLHIVMLGEIFQTSKNEQREQQLEWQGCEEFLNCDKNENPKLPVILSLCDLYEEFVRKKFYDIHLQKKARDLSKIGADDDAVENFEAFEERHEILALLSLFNQEDLKGLFSQEKMDKAKTWVKKYESAARNEGIIDIRNNRPHFSHRTFAEYFTAKFLARQSSQNEKSIQTFIVTNILIKWHHRVIRSFLFEFYGKNKLNTLIWNERIVDVLERINSYDLNFVDDEITNTLEKMMENTDSRSSRHLLNLLKEYGCEHTINEIITDSCYLTALENDYVKNIDLLLNHVDSKRVEHLLSLCDYSNEMTLLEKIAKDPNYGFKFKKLARKSLTSSQIRLMFDNPKVWQRLKENPSVRGDSKFIRMFKKLIGDDNLFNEIMNKYSEYITFLDQISYDHDSEISDTELSDSDKSLDSDIENVLLEIYDNENFLAETSYSAASTSGTYDEDHLQSH